jgi:alpha-tubulin suppressor-like RCC1 family protein
MMKVLASPSSPCRVHERHTPAPARAGACAALLVTLGGACAGGSALAGRGGASTAGVSTVPVVMRAKQLALGAYHTCMLVESGRVACWGDNQQGQLGNGGEQPSAAPVWVSGLDDAIEIRSSNAATCARRRGGRVACWGGNAHGEAAPSARMSLNAASGAWDHSGEPPSYTPGNAQRRPAEIAELSGAHALAMGSRHGCALDGAGHVTCWGDASFGQLGPGVADAFQLRVVAGLPPLVELSAAGEDTCGRTASGEVWCWGASGGVSTPPGNNSSSSSPVKTFTGATQLQVLAGRTCAWNARGDVTCWGDSGACADTGEPSPPMPVADYRGSLALARAAGGCFWCLLRPSYELSCDAPPPESRRIDIVGVRSIVAGNDHACAIRDDGSVWCWGSNVRGQLGRLTTKTRDPDPAPVQWAR